MTAQQILDTAAEAQTALETLEQSLATRIDEIEGLAFDAHREFTAAETAERDRLRAALAETRDAMSELAFVTLQQLDASDTVKGLLDKMRGVNQQIGHDLDRLKQIAAFAATAAQVADTLAKLATGLATLAATFA